MIRPSWYIWPGLRTPEPTAHEEPEPGAMVEETGRVQPLGPETQAEETTTRNRLAPDPWCSGASIPNVLHWAGEGRLRLPFEPLADSRARPGGPVVDRLVADHSRTRCCCRTGRRRVRSPPSSMGARQAQNASGAAATSSPVGVLRRDRLPNRLDDLARRFVSPAAHLGSSKGVVRHDRDPVLPERLQQPRRRDRLPAPHGNTRSALSPVSAPRRESPPPASPGRTRCWTPRDSPPWSSGLSPPNPASRNRAGESLATARLPAASLQRQHRSTQLQQMHCPDRGRHCYRQRVGPDRYRPP